MNASPLRITEPSEEHLVSLLRQHAEPLPALDGPRFADAFERFADARMVLIGEASHGTSEFCRARAAITRRLIERHGFSIVAVEADWPDAARIDCYCRQRESVAWTEDTFKRFPTWMWRNREVDAFVRWLHEHNAALDAARRVEFRGLDVYSLGSSIREVLRYLDQTDPEAAADARQRYGCLSPWQEDPADYGRNVMLGQPTCEKAVIEQLEALLAQRLEYIGQDERFFNAERNARVVLAAESYYRAMYRGSTESWNLRDRHMFDTLRALLDHRGANAKAVIWAHNSHIGNAAATSMGWGGEFNIGELCRTAFGRDAVLIGMATDHGEVAAAANWDEPMQIKQVIPSRSDSWEQLFLRAGVPASLTDWRDDRGEFRKALSHPRLERAIGVIYRPLTERQSHYFRAILAEQFDALIWFDQTQAVTPIGPQDIDASVVPDTYPFGE
ncbi:erythromycin esterase family protein [Stutzerimonas xanthomarina]|nr:erythromycin esterase family protein [Stutzerimonas xanthomarina]